MLRKNIRTFSLLFFLSFLLFNVNSQTFTTSNSGTNNWANSSNWVVSNVCSGGGYSAPPPTSSAWWPNCPINIVINRNMTLSGSFVSNSYVNSITISNGATLTITGNLDFENNTPGTSFISVNSGSSLIVNGTFTVKKNLNILGNLTVGTLIVNNGVTFNPSTVNASTLNLNGRMQVSSLLNVFGTTTVNNGSALLTLLTGASFESNLLNVNSGVVTINNGAQAVFNSLTTGNQSSVEFNNSGNTIVNGSVSFNGLINNYGFLSAINLIGQGSGTSVFNNFGDIDFTGNITLPSSSKLNLMQNSTTIVDGNVTVNANNNLTVGTNTTTPNYTDIVIKGDLISTGSGDVTVRRNGRLAVWGNFNATDNSGGTFLTLLEGGQMYVEGDITFTGGGNYIDNKNTDGSYLGLYVGSDSKISFSPNSGSGFVGGFKEGEEYENQNSTNSGYTRLESMPIENNPFLEWLKLQPESPIPSSPLPVDLLYLKVNCIDEASKIIWATASENNSSHFDIESSRDGTDWNHVTHVKAMGNSQELTNYEFILPSSFNSSNYLILRQVDLDGIDKIYGPISNNCQNKDIDFKTFPNPSNVAIGFAIKSHKTQKIEVKAHSVSGELLFYETYLVQEGEEIIFPSLNLSPGVYLIEAKFEDGKILKNKQTILN